jgi:catechol 2,3-dioxygenase
MGRPQEAFRILRLGHCVLRVRDLSAARSFSIDVLCFVPALEERDALSVRGIADFDLWTLGLVQADEPGLDHFALRVEYPDDLDALEELHRTLGVPVTRVEAGREPGQGEALRVRTPDGHPVEFYHHMEQVPVYDDRGRVRLPMRSTHRFRGIPPMFIDYKNLRVEDPDASLTYWRDHLRFSISEYTVRDGKTFAAWLRRRRGTHDVAVVRSTGPSLHHVAYHVGEPADVMRTADLLADAGFRAQIDFGPGRHGLSNAFFIDVRDPSGNRLEIYMGDYQRDLDAEPIRWEWEDYDEGGRLWWSPEYPARFLETTPVNPSWPL